jgi:type I restriction enzyme S subunit
VKVKEVPFSWIPRSGHRLDVEPFVGGAVEARLALESLKGEAQPLHAVTAGGMSGIVHAGRIKRQWVEDPRYGTRFLSSTDILRADLTHCSLISNKAVRSNPLLIIRKGWTLITRAGTVGRMAYSRPDMDGMACTEDVLRVVPDSEAIPSGYLFAFLNSKYGLPMVTSGTYGAIIQHIEPEHIADLPVPRLGRQLEGRVHQLVEHAAEARSTAVKLLADAQTNLAAQLGLGNWTTADDGLSTTAKAGWLLDRLDAYYYSPRCIFARQAFDRARNCEPRRLHTVAEVFIPGIFKRLYADDPRFGVPYITGADVFQIAPTSEQYLQRRVAEVNALVVKKGMILVQEAGQLGGLIGRSVLVGDHLDGFAVSNNMIRVSATDQADVGYLFAVLSSEPGVTLIAREAAGSSIPHIDANRIRQLELPWAPRALREEIGAPVVQAWDLTGC